MAAEQEEVPANIAAAITEISEHATLLIRDEIELARAEIAREAAQARRPAPSSAIAAGGFVVVARAVRADRAGLAVRRTSCSPPARSSGASSSSPALLLVLAVLAGLLAFRALRGGAPPAPTMAIDEARKIREAVVARGRRG